MYANKKANSTIHGFYTLEARSTHPYSTYQYTTSQLTCIHIYLYHVQHRIFQYVPFQKSDLCTLSFRYSCWKLVLAMLQWIWKVLRGYFLSSHLVVEDHSKSFFDLWSQQPLATSSSQKLESGLINSQKCSTPITLVTLLQIFTTILRSLRKFNSFTE